MQLLSADTQKAFSGLCMTFPSVAAEVLCTVLRGTGEILVLVTHRLKRLFGETGLEPNRRKEVNVNYVSKHRRLSLSYSSESSPTAANVSVTRRHSLPPELKDQSKGSKATRNGKGTASAAPRRIRAEGDSSLPKAGVKRAARND